MRWVVGNSDGEVVFWLRLKDIGLLRLEVELLRHHDYYVLFASSERKPTYEMSKPSVAVR
jgi:hypothetical protein